MTEEKKDEISASIKSDEGEQKTVFTLEEVDLLKKEMSSNYEKWVQKVFNEKKELEKVIDAVASISENPSTLISLYEEDSKIAQIILDKYYHWQSIEDFKSDIGYKEDLSDPETAKKAIEKAAEKLANERIIESQKKDFLKKLALSTEQITAFNEVFDERKSLKSFKIQDLEKHFEKVLKELDIDIDKTNLTTAIAASHSQGDWNSSTSWTQVLSIRKEAKEFVQKFGT